MTSSIRSIYEKQGQKVYFLGNTPEERASLIRQIVAIVQSRIVIPRAIDGKTPTKDEILALIRPLIPKVKDGHTPTKAELLALIEPLIPEPVPGANGTTPTNEELTALIKPLIAAQLASMPPAEPQKPTADEITGIVEPIIRKLLTEQRKGWFGGGGGGDLTAAGFGLTVTTNAIGRKTFALDPGVIPVGNSVVEEEVSGSGTTWTLAHTPSANTLKVFANGQRLKATTDYTLAGDTITTVLSWDAGSILADYSYI